MLYCKTCGKEIDLEFTPEEEVEITSQMNEHSVVMICMECSDYNEDIQREID